MRTALATASLLLVALLAGCLSGSPDDTGAPGAPGGPAVRPQPPEDSMPRGDGHDHGDPSQHRLLWNYDFVHRDPMGQTPITTAGLHALKTADGHLFGAVYGHHMASANGGLMIWSLEDPERPQQVGHFAVPGHVGGDRSLGVTPDGSFAVLGAETVTCFGHVNPTPVNAYLIDTRDKADPRLADTITVAGPSLGTPLGTSSSIGTHSVWVHEIDGDDYAFVFGKIYRIDRGGPSGASLVDTGARLNVGHDLYVRDTPWGDVWGLSANGGRNFQVYDLTDPTDPVEIAVFEGGDGHYLHTADVWFFDDGQIIMVLTSEDWQEHVSPMWVFDATDLRGHAGSEPMLLEPVHVWGNPGGATAENMHFSIHNPRFHDGGILSLSHYHGGLIQLDFRHPELRHHPAEIAYAVYADDDPPLMVDPVQSTVESQLCQLGLSLDTPMYLDVEIGPGGILYAADVHMGLYVFKPTEDHPAFGAAS